MVKKQKPTQKKKPAEVQLEDAIKAAKEKFAAEEKANEALKQEHADKIATLPDRNPKHTAACFLVDTVYEIERDIVMKGKETLESLQARERSKYGLQADIKDLLYRFDSANSYIDKLQDSPDEIREIIGKIQGDLFGIIRPLNDVALELFEIHGPYSLEFVREHILAAYQGTEECRSKANLRILAGHLQVAANRLLYTSSTDNKQHDTTGEIADEKATKKSEDTWRSLESFLRDHCGYKGASKDMILKVKRRLRLKKKKKVVKLPDFHPSYTRGGTHKFKLSELITYRQKLLDNFPDIFHEGNNSNNVGKTDTKPIPTGKIKL